MSQTPVTESTEITEIPDSRESTEITESKESTEVQKLQKVQKVQKVPLLTTFWPVLKVFDRFWTFKLKKKLFFDHFFKILFYIYINIFF